MAPESPSVRRPLTPLQRRFVEEYLIDLNGTEAAVRAGYSKKTAKAIACQVLKVQHVTDAIEEAMASRGERTGITADRVLRELERLAFSDLDNYTVDDNGDLKLADGAPKNAMRAVQSVKRRIIHTPIGDGHTVRTCEVEIRLWDKPGALKIAGRHVDVHGFADRVEVSGRNGGPILTRDITKSYSDAELDARIAEEIERAAGAKS